MIEFDMNVAAGDRSSEVVDPQFSASPFPHTMYPAISLSSRVYPNGSQQLLARGHKLRVTGPWSDGALAAIVVDLENRACSAPEPIRVWSVRVGVVGHDEASRSRIIFVIISAMSAHFDDIERQARLLPLKEKACSCPLLIEELDTLLMLTPSNVD